MMCRAMDELMANGDKNEIYNIGTGVSRSFREIIEYCKEKVGSTSEIIDVPFPDDQDYLQIKNFTMNVDKLNAIGFVPKLDIDTGLDMMCEVY